MAWVKNINGTSDNNCKCGSWLSHWEKFSGKSAVLCSEINCVAGDLVGAHVQKEDINDSNWYIVPLCSVHNKSKITLDIGGTKLVSANKSLTCK